MIQTVSWNKVWGNRYLQRLAPEMLLPGGQRIRKITRTIGTTTLEDRDVYDVVYDAGYVKEKLTKTVLEPLGITGKDELINLINKIL